MKKIIIFLCFFSLKISYSQVSDFNKINFTRADNIATLNKGENLKNLPLLTHKLTYKLTTDVEKFRAIYKWVCENIKGDMIQHKKVARKRKKLKNDSLQYLEWNNYYKKIAFKKLLENKKTMCTGYAYLIKEMAFLAGIKSKIINGYGRTVDSNINNLEIENHSWNAVKLSNKWYLCDATWSSGYSDYNGLFIADYNDGYFLTEPTLFAKNHYPIEKKWLLNKTTTENKFTTSPLIYNEAFKYKIIPILPSNMNLKILKESELSFKYKTLKNISTNKISLVHYVGNVEREINIINLKKDKNNIQFKHKFKRKGMYDIHLKINNDIVASYTVKVYN